MPKGGTYTFSALQRVREYSLTSSAGARSGVPKAVVVLTDGLSASAISTRIQAEKLHNESVEVYSIGTSKMGYQVKAYMKSYISFETAASFFSSKTCTTTGY